MTFTSPLFVIAKNELKTLAREKTFLLLLGIFLAMTFFSVYIGWSTRTTTSAIYDATVSVLQSVGVTTIPQNPILNVSPLVVFDNMIIYILLVGALLSIVIGHRSFIRERTSGVLPLVFVRPIQKGTYVAGKLLGVGAALLGIILGTLLVSICSALFIPALHLSGVEFLRLFGFYAVSLLYLAFFALLGFVCAIRFSSESIALFVPIMIWIALVFIVPELATGQNPVALLNPITLSQALPNTNPFFTFMRTVLEPFSVGQYYTESAMMFLKAGSNASLSLSQGLAQVGGSLAGVTAYLVLLGGGSIAALRSYAIATDPLL